MLSLARAFDRLSRTGTLLTGATLLASWALTVRPALAQVSLDQGIVGTGLQLRGLDGEKRVLMIGAHPDDEDTALLTALARGMGASTAYLSLTRGDGGQNLIGPELGEGLGAVRTGELLAARSLDGGDQFFTRAFDYGFSKSADEALAMWPREELLRDVVWVVRTFRPQVIVSIFSGTPADGHGQHQAAGIMAREVFDAAADPTRFPELTALGAAPWQVGKLDRRAWGDDATQ
ncbi:MAG TPA: PIG-L family deacetylase, partial [Longimicrobiales bacterium]|nr:PIG-L family deacetylase [Longimicrobiales bacterium]